jgi:hypothetical protein
MQTLSIVLVLISIGTIVGPMAGAVIIYRDNLSQLVVPPQINSLINGNNNNGNNSNNESNVGSGNFGAGDGGGGFPTTTFVNSQINDEAKTFTVTVNVTNNFNYDLTINSLNATVESSQDHYQLGTISLDSPVIIMSNQTSLVTVSGAWTQEAADHVQNNFAGATSINVDLAYVTIDVNGIIIQQTQPINVGDIPLT